MIVREARGEGRGGDALGPVLVVLQYTRRFGQVAITDKFYVFSSPVDD